MIDMKKILVPVDFSEHSKSAVNYGLSLALQFNAKLALTHIVPSLTPSIYTYPAEAFAFEHDRAIQVTSMLRLLIPEEYRDRVGMETIVRVGEVRDELLDIIDAEKMDLVVMGTRGRNVVERFLLGSVTERMLRKLPVPVITVSHLDPARELHTIGPVPLRHVMYATDLSEGSGIGLNFSAELARRSGAHLSVVHVVKLIETIYWGAEGYLWDALEKVKEDARKRLRLSVEGLDKDVKATPVLLEGSNISGEILEFAAKNNVDMIVLDLQGKTAVERALLGSTAERVIRSASIPVLSIPVVPDSVAKKDAA